MPVTPCGSPAQIIGEPVLVEDLRNRFGARPSDEESGFTLIELLVVMLIIGLLAAIAIPAFLNHSSKAREADAKENAHTAQIAIETYATDNNGSYAGATRALLVAREPSITGWQSRLTVTVTATTYTVKVKVKSGTATFSIARAAGGAVTYPCVGGKSCISGKWGA